MTTQVSSLTRTNSIWCDLLDENFQSEKLELKRKMQFDNFRLDSSDVKFMDIELSQIVEPRILLQRNYTFLKSHKTGDFNVPDVVSLPMLDIYVCIDGVGQLRQMKAKGVETTLCRVIGVAGCQSQINVARGRAITSTKQPPTDLDLCLAILITWKQLVSDFGEDVFFGWGGDRRSPEQNMDNKYKIFSPVFNLKLETARMLFSFAEKLGESALLGLSKIPDMKNLSRRRINHLNGPLSEVNIAHEIENIYGTEITPDHYESAAGEIAFQRIRDIEDDLKRRKNDPSRVVNQQILKLNKLLANTSGIEAYRTKLDRNPLKILSDKISVLLG